VHVRCKCETYTNFVHVPFAEEMLVPSGPKHYVNHMLGLEKLVALRDPSLDCSEQTIHLYKCLRYLMIFACIGAGQPSILAKPEWKALLRRHCQGEEEMREQQLYDALADCSVLMAELSELLKRWEMQDSGHESQIETTRRRTQDLHRQLRAWRGEWDMNPANAWTKGPAETVPRDNDETLPDPSSLVIPNMATALTLMLYDTALIYVLHILITLPLESQPQYTTRDYVNLAHSAVLEICRTMPDPSDEKLHADMHSAPALHWALMVAHMILQNDTSEEGRRLVDLLNWKSASISTKSIWTT